MAVAATNTAAAITHRDTRTITKIKDPFGPGTGRAGLLWRRIYSKRGTVRYTVHKCTQCLSFFNFTVVSCVVCLPDEHALQPVSSATPVADEYVPAPHRSQAASFVMRSATSALLPC